MVAHPVRDGATIDTAMAITTYFLMLMLIISLPYISTVTNPDLNSPIAPATGTIHTRGVSSCFFRALPPLVSHLSGFRAKPDTTFATTDTTCLIGAWVRPLRYGPRLPLSQGFSSPPLPPGRSG